MTTRSVTASRIKRASSSDFPQILLAEAGAGEPCRRDVEEIRKAARGCVMI
jgi:hypothetical protein